MASKGAQQAMLTAMAVARTPSLAGFYRYQAPAITPGDYEFHLDLLRPRLPALSLDRMVQALTWDDTQTTLSGSVTAYYPDPSDPSAIPVTRGQLIRCSVDWGGKNQRYRLWTMRVGAPTPQVDTGSVSIPLSDDTALLDGGTRDWWFRKTKRRPYGYFADEIAGSVASTLGVKVRGLVRGSVRQEVKLKAATGLAVIKRAYSNEQTHSGRSFIIRIRDGELEVVPLQRNPTLFVLSRQIQTALITQNSGSKVPTTVLTGRGHVGSGKGAQRVSWTEYDRAVVRLLGYVHDTKDYGRVESAADLKGRVQRDLASRLRINNNVQITHGGIPFIGRGDAVEVNLPAWGYGGAQSFVFCIGGTHTVQAGLYQSSWTFNASDPYLQALKSEQKAQAARAKKAAARKRSKVAAAKGK